MKSTAKQLSDNESYEALRRIDIITAINYFGVVEILDHISDSMINSYLMINHNDAVSDEATLAGNRI